jgi:hypothetical protein
MAVNYKRLGRSGRGVVVFALGLIATTLILVLPGWGQEKAAAVLAAACLAGTIPLARCLQGHAVDDHVARGGALASTWKAVGAGIAMLVVVLGEFFVILMLQGVGSVTIGAKDQVVYSGTATKDQATALGNALKTVGFFQDSGSIVLLHKEGGSTTLSFVVRNDAWNDPLAVKAYESVVWRVAPAIGGLPIDMRLVTAWHTVEKDEMVKEGSAGPGPPERSSTPKSEYLYFAVAE